MGPAGANTKIRTDTIWGVVQITGTEACRHRKTRTEIRVDTRVYPNAIQKTNTNSHPRHSHGLTICWTAGAAQRGMNIFVRRGPVCAPWAVISNEERNPLHRGLRILPAIEGISGLGRFLLPLVVEMTLFARSR